MAIVTHASCPACGSPRIHTLIAYEDFPAILWPIEREKRFDVSGARIDSWACDSCRHVFLNHVDEEFTKGLYARYYYLYPFTNLETMHAPYRDAFNAVAARHLTKPDGTLLEIGCDNADHMQLFLDRGLACTAVNPGASGGGPVRFIDGFYGDVTIDQRFDYVVARFNLEHIIDLDGFFRALDGNLAPGGLAILQVPNNARLVAAGVLSVLAHEHTHYFCRPSLLALLGRCGYDVLSVSDDDASSLVCVVTSRRDAYDPAAGVQAATAMMQEVRAFLASRRNTRVYMYGVSMSLTGILYSGLIEPDLLSSVIVVDDNTVLHGKYMPRTDMKIVPPDAAEMAADATVLLTLNPIYYGAALARLATLGVRKHVFALDERGLRRIGSTEPHAL